MGTNTGVSAVDDLGLLSVGSFQVPKAKVDFGRLTTSDPFRYELAGPNSPSAIPDHTGSDGRLGMLLNQQRRFVGPLTRHPDNRPP